MLVRNRSVLVFLLVWTSLPASLHGQTTHAHDGETLKRPQGARKVAGGADLEQVARQIVDRTNAFRKDEGRRPVAVNAQLAETARSFAGYMARTDKYGHTADGHSPAERARQHDYDYCIVLENIAYQFRSTAFTTEELARGFFEGWKSSPGHRRNMLDPDVTETGVAVARSEETGYYYAVLMFGRPKSQAVEYRVANRTGADVRYRIGERTLTLQPQYTRTHIACRPDEVTFLLPDGKEQKEQKVRPKRGDRFVITKGDEGYQVRKESR